MALPAAYNGDNTPVPPTARPVFFRQPAQPFCTNEWHILERWRHELEDRDIPCQMYNVGCMMTHMKYTPRTLEEILEAYRELKEKEIVDVAERILNEYRDAFEKLAKGPDT